MVAAYRTEIERLAARKESLRKYRAGPKYRTAVRKYKARLRRLDSYLRHRHKKDGIPEPTRPRASACECCGKAPQGRRLDTDHCHTTGKFRGWLCWGCNVAIGKLGDNLHGVLRAADYLRRCE
jgi:hypothetical protein